MKAQIFAVDGLPSGIVIWADAAYSKTMLFDPVYRQTYFKSWVKAMIDQCHKTKLPFIYHGCGKVELVFEDLREIGVDAYNPLESKTNMDAVMKTTGI